jgi:hypothetical protein
MLVHGSTIIYSDVGGNGHIIESNKSMKERPKEEQAT